MTVSIGTGVSTGNVVTSETNPLTGGIRNLEAAGVPVQTFVFGSMIPYRLATFGDSRANANGTHLTTSTAGTISGEKVPGSLCQIRGDMQVVFNGGISGGLTSDWNSAGRASSSQTVKDLIAATPDLCYIQFGINDYIAGVSASTVVGYLKAAIDKIIGAGIPVIFESCNPAAAAATSYINGYSSAGGFGENAASKLAEMQAGNAAMKTWLAQFPSNIALYVDTSTVTTSADGYAKTDKTYYDGTHMSRMGCFAAANIINSASLPFFPIKSGQRVKCISPNGINRSFLSPTSGRAANFSAIVVENGTATATYQIVTDEDGDLCQEYNVSVTSVGGSTFRVRCDMLPDWVGATPFVTLSAGNILQGAFDYTIDDGSGNAPIAYNVYGRCRIYYDDASNEYTQHGSVAQTASTDFPAITGAESGCILTPRLAVKTAMASGNMTAATSLQCHVIGNQTGTFRLRIKNPQWGKVA